MIRYSLLALLVLSACANKLPRHHDVQTSSTELCEHYTGEDGYDEERAAFLARQAALYCSQ